MTDEPDIQHGHGQTQERTQPTGQESSQQLLRFRKRRNGTADTQSRKIRLRHRHYVDGEAHGHQRGQSQQCIVISCRTARFKIRQLDFLCIAIRRTDAAGHLAIHQSFGVVLRNVHHHIGVAVVQVHDVAQHRQRNIQSAARRHHIGRGRLRRL